MKWLGDKPLHTLLYVSRGLGFEGFAAPRARLFSPPEIVVVSLRGEGKDG
jgi:predicted MPP superfamily phosphohydrolase